METETPPAPNPGMSNALTSGAAPMAPGNALASGAPNAPPGQPGQPQAAPAPLTHAQVVTGLRHFDAVKRELEVIAKDPALGKSSVKSKIIDGVLRLVAAGYMKTTQAVDELSKVPTEPLLQMKWTKTMLAQAQQAENAILDHYGQTSPHFGTVADHMAMTGGLNDRYEHQDHIGAMMGNLKGVAANG
jgi:hypothetical protein